MSTIRELTDQIDQYTVEKGWRETINSWGEYVALLHTEISEILENFRDRGLTAYTTATGKPDDIGSEVADCVIRLLDMCSVHRIPVYDMDMELGDVSPLPVSPEFTVNEFGDWVALLHHYADRMWANPTFGPPLFLRIVMAFAVRWGIDVEREVDRKMAYNRTRPYQHGGRTLAGKAGQR